MDKKKVVVQLPAVANEAPVAQRYSLELESLDAIAEIVEVDGSDPETFLQGAHDADALITSWGINIDAQIIGGLQKCVVIGVGSVGVDMVDVDAATRAGIVGAAGIERGAKIVGSNIRANLIRQCSKGCRSQSKGFWHACNRLRSLCL